MILLSSTALRAADRMLCMSSLSRLWLSALTACLILCGCGGSSGSNSVPTGNSSSSSSAGSSSSTGSTSNSGSSSGTGSSGSTGSNLSLSVSPLSVSVTAAQGQAAPTATVQVSVSGLSVGQEVYLGGSYTPNGLTGLSDASGTSPVAVALQFKTPASLAVGVYTDTVTLMGCMDQNCTQQINNSPQQVTVTYTVTASIVKVTSLSPSTTVAGGSGFALTVNGSNFSLSSQVQWNGTPRSTTYVSSTQLTAQITAADIAAAGTAAVSVIDPTNGASNQLNFSITPQMLSLTQISPTNVTAGSPAFSLTVLGTGFTSTSQVLWNGTALTATLVGSHELVAQIPATDVASVGSASITVHDPNSSVGTTTAATLTIAAPSTDAVSFLINPAHTGSTTFASVSFPTSAAWTVDVGGTPSFALIAKGDIYLTVGVGSSSLLMALDQATGNTVWGPISLAGNSATAAYDSGKVFVMGSTIGSTPTLEAYDAQSGQRLWSTLLAGQYWFSGGVTAANGYVYVGGAGSGGTLYALDENNGNIVWTQGVQNGDNSAPAVSNDGVYVTYPCWTYDFRPATGESIWNSNTGCEGGGGATPVVANQLVYSPNASGYSGLVYNAETGSNQGSFSAASPPAFTSDTGYFLQSGTLRGITVSNSTVKWSFAGDGQLNGSPIVVNQYVFIASGSGNLYGIDGSTGQQVWQVTLPAPFTGTTTTISYSALSAGDGLLVVPTGTKVSAFVLSP